MDDKALDFLAIGLGPFNLGLACLAHPIANLEAVFLEQKEQFAWHPGMLLEGATLQTPFLGDLVTMADPTSPFSFLNYLKAHGRIFAFYIRENFFPSRTEYNQYCQWVADQLPTITFGRKVERVDYDEAERIYRVQSLCTETGRRYVHRAKRLVLGTGTAPHVPLCCRGVASRVLHTAGYLDDKASLQARRSITIVGSGQSAAEVYYDLLKDIDRFGYALNWITRSPRFFPLELTKLTLEMTSPDYTDYFHELSEHKRDALIESQKGLYKGINVSLISDIYSLLYEKSLAGPVHTALYTNTEMRACEFDEASGTFSLDLYQREQEIAFRREADALILGTGYSYRLPEFLQPIAGRIAWDHSGRFVVGRNYSVDVHGGEIFVQNAELHTHGFVAPDLGMGCYRNACILREILGYEHYPIERRIAFQRFGAPAALHPLSEAAWT